MSFEPITAVLEETLAEANVLEANGVNVAPLRRFAGKLESALVVAQNAAIVYLSTREHGRRVGVSGETVRQWCIAGKISGAIRVGAQWKIPK